MVWLLFLVLAAAEPPPGSDFRVETDSPERGVYRLWARETLDARAAQLAAVLDAAKCRQDCDYAVDHVVEDVELERGETQMGRLTVSSRVTYSRIDSVLDASYFTVVEVRAEPGRIVHELETADDATIERWTTGERRHDPLFHFQRGRWTLTEEFDAAGVFRHTEVAYELEMRSDRFLVNLAPGRVLVGAANHVRTIFGFLRETEGHTIGPGE